MAVEGELNGLGKAWCSDCQQELPLQVCQSAAGFYLGHFCPKCGPYGRETGYMTEDEAKVALDKVNEGKEIENVRDTRYHPADFKVKELPKTQEEFFGRITEILKGDS